MRKYLTALKNHAATLIPMIVLLLIGFTATAHAADAVTPPDGSLLDVARPVYDAIMAGHYIASVALALVLGVALLKRYTGNTSKLGKFVHGDIGGALTTFAVSFFGAIATATLATGSGWAGLSLSVLKVSSGVAVAAIGGYTIIKKLVIPLLKPIAAKAPAWMQPVFSILFWAFDKPDATTTATDAGNAAVAASPAQGTTAVTGDKPTEIS